LGTTEDGNPLKIKDASQELGLKLVFRFVWRLPKDFWVDVFYFQGSKPFREENLRSFNLSYLDYCHLKSAY
jgi:hypothetical protein